LSEATNSFEQALEPLRRKLAALEICLSEKQEERLLSFCRLLAKRNQNVNLVAKADPANVLLERVMDSLTIAPLVQRLAGAGKSLVDIGSGAGFPGLPLAIILDDWSVTLVESVRKKTDFLVEAIAAADLTERVQVAHERAESLARRPKQRESFDVATARAVGSLEIICEFAIPLLRVGGTLIAQKSARQIEEEASLAKAVLPALGAKIVEIVHPWPASEGKERVAILIQKTQHTPEKFPRPMSRIRRNV